MTLPLTFHPALSRPDLLAPPVAAALRELPWADQVRVAAIDPSLSDTAQFCEAYGITLEESANCARQNRADRSAIQVRTCGSCSGDA